MLAVLALQRVQEKRAAKRRAVKKKVDKDVNQFLLDENVRIEMEEQRRALFEELWGPDGMVEEPEDPAFTEFTRQSARDMEEYRLTGRMTGKK